jgi:hypothetical protein
MKANMLDYTKREISQLPDDGWPLSGSNTWLFPTNGSACAKTCKE